MSCDVSVYCFVHKLIFHLVCLCKLFVQIKYILIDDDVDTLVTGEGITDLAVDSPSGLVYTFM